MDAFDGLTQFLSTRKPLPTSPVHQNNEDNHLSTCYCMGSNPRGLCVIINNKQFSSVTGLQRATRHGTDRDAQNLLELFQEIGHEVYLYNDQSISEMRNLFYKISCLDFSNLSSFVLCILSHGKEGYVFGFDGLISIKEISSYFNGENMSGKPKFFIIQACQGKDFMSTIEDTTDGEDDAEQKINLPTGSDFLYAYSVAPGYYSFRNPSTGSWFVNALVDVFRKYSHKMEVMRMLTRVNHVISTQRSYTTSARSNNKCQIPAIVSHLRKDLFLRPVNGPLRSYTGDFITTQ